LHNFTNIFSRGTVGNVLGGLINDGFVRIMPNSGEKNIRVLRIGEKNG